MANGRRQSRLLRLTRSVFRLLHKVNSPVIVQGINDFVLSFLVPDGESAETANEGINLLARCVQNVRHDVVLCLYLLVTLVGDAQICDERSEEREGERSDEEGGCERSE